MKAGNEAKTAGRLELQRCFNICGRRFERTQLQQWRFQPITNFKNISVLRPTALMLMAAESRYSLVAVCVAYVTLGFVKVQCN